jgi:hypothetical protein
MKCRNLPEVKGTHKILGLPTFHALFGVDPWGMIGLRRRHVFLLHDEYGKWNISRERDARRCIHSRRWREISQCFFGP